MTFIVFNRPDSTEAVFNAIRRAKPDKLFVIADAPRPGNRQDAEHCALVRKVIESVDWNCQVFRNYADENLGCHKRIASGLSWVFEQVPDSIILEDDCLPHPSFFPYCVALLDRYRDDERVMTVSGDSCQYPRSEYSYYFSKYFHCWGWASWARAWRHFDLSMSGWPEFRDSGGLECWCPNPKERHFWTGLLDQQYSQPGRHWDFSFLYTCWAQSGLSILPRVNLISNMGWGPSGTHTRDAYCFLGNRPIKDIGEIFHPPFVVRDERADQYEWEQRYDAPLSAQVKAKLLSLFGRCGVP